MTHNDLGHRFNHVLEPLPRIDETERREDRPVLDPELALETMPAARLDGGHAVLDHHRRPRHAVDVAKKTRRGRSHHHDLYAVLRGETHRVERPGLGLRRDRMECDDDGLRAVFEEYAQVVVVRAVVPDAVEAELVLQI